MGGCKCAEVKAHLKAKYKCVCITMCSLVMSSFSRDYIKTEIDYKTYLNVCSIHTAPGFQINLFLGYTTNNRQS